MSEQPTLAIEVEDAGPCSKLIKITVPAARVDREIEDTFKNVQKAVHFKGFRPGKAPRKLVESRLGENVFEDVKKRLIETAVQEAIDEQKLETLGEASAELDKVDLARGADMAFEVTVDVRPKFDLPDLKTIKVEQPQIEISDDDVEKELQRLRLERATSADGGDGPLEENGIATLHIEVKVGDETIVDADDIEWVHPSDVLGGMLMEGLSEALIGKKKGETASLTCPLPENFRDESFRGKDADIELRVDAIQKVTLPELDDTFAAEMDYDDLDELRDEVRKQLDRELEKQREKALDNAVVDAALEAIPFDVPPSLLQRETGRMLQRYRSQLQLDGIGEDQIIEEMARAQAEAEVRVKRDIRASFVLERLASERKVFATESEVQQEVTQMAASYGRSPPEMEEYLERNGMMGPVRSSIRERKTLAELRGLVTIEGSADTGSKQTEKDDA